MALQSQVWPLATHMPMAESSLYRQRLEIIAEKRRLQEAIGAARRELEEEKLRVERLKRKSLRERWLMDGAAEGPEQPEDPASKDPQSPEGQAQARIRNLEDSLFTLQSQLQLLQSASTGAQHKPSGRATRRRQGPRPLSQPTMEAGPAGQMEVDKRASLPAGPVGVSPESPSGPREEAAGDLPALRLVPGAVGASSEANGPYPGSSPPREQASQGAVPADGGVAKAKGGGVVEVVWAGLRATEDCAMEVTGAQLEAKVEEVVLEAIGDRQAMGSLELPAWVKEDRSVVEAVWEGLGGSDSEATGEVASGPEAAQISSRGLQQRLEGEASRERGSPEGDGQGGSGGEEGSFIWVERVTLSEDWEDLLMEGLEGPMVTGREGGGEEKVGTEKEAGREPLGVDRKCEGPWRTDRERGDEKPKVEMTQVEKEGDEEKLEAENKVEEPLGVEKKEIKGHLGAEEERGEEKLGVEKKEVEEPLGVEKKGGEGKPKAAEEPLVAERKGSERPLNGERKGGEEPLEVERKGSEVPSEVEREGGEGPLEVERKGGEVPSEVETKGHEAPSEVESKGGEEPSEVESKGGEEPSEVESKGGEEPSEVESKGGEEPSEVESKGGEEPSEVESKGGEEPSEVKSKGGEGPLDVEKTQGAEEELVLEEQRGSGERTKSQAEEVSEAGAPLGVKQEPRQNDPGQHPQEKQEGFLQEEAVKPEPPAESQGPPSDVTALLEETPAPEQPPESQPLLQREGPSANPSAHSAPTYAPARQPEPAVPTEGEEASGPKQKTCQCCVVM